MGASVNRIYGVDFSAARDAGRHVWLASGLVAGDILEIEDCRPAEHLPGSGRNREQCLQALTAFVANSGACAFGLDFPFGLPAPLVEGETWERFVLSFPGRYRTPEAFRAACRAVAGRKELKRLTDVGSKTPFSAYNLRLYRQTYYGIRHVLEPLVRNDLARVLPMQPRVSGKPVVFEICPASTLKHQGLYVSYKGKEEKCRLGRTHILNSLEQNDGLKLSTARLAAAILEDHGGDALDSIIAALAAFRAIRTIEAYPSETHLLEGYVFI